MYMETKIQVVMVTGMSGAGKTSAMAVFENMEYQCIDNYPVLLLEQFGELLKTSHRYSKVAMGISLNDAINAIRILGNLDWLSLSIVFLDCEDQILLTRYKFTRRVHPLLISNRASSLSEAIAFERKIAEPVKQMANIVVDTSYYNLAKFQDHLERLFAKGGMDSFRISFVSFGFKHGIPRDVDLLFDVRFLPNPYYIESLRELTGNDQAVYDYVMEKAETQEFVRRMTEMFDYLFVNFEKEGKMHLVVGIGCTGGQHRSVTLTNYFADYYANRYQVHRLHRDAEH